VSHQRHVHTRLAKAGTFGDWRGCVVTTAKSIGNRISGGGGLMNDVVTRFVRVAASSVWAWLAAALLQYLGLAFTPEQSLAVEAAIIILLTGLANAGIGLLGKRWPVLERLLLVKSAPVYVERWK
jgi:FAD/FMN-containing dehydrogenase